MKRLSFILALVLVLSFVGCGNMNVEVPDEPANAQEASEENVSSEEKEEFGEKVTIANITFYGDFQFTEDTTDNDEEQLSFESADGIASGGLKVSDAISGKINQENTESFLKISGPIMELEAGEFLIGDKIGYLAYGTSSDQPLIDVACVAFDYREQGYVFFFAAPSQPADYAENFLIMLESIEFN